MHLFSCVYLTLIVFQLLFQHIDKLEL